MSIHWDLYDSTNLKFHLYAQFFKDEVNYFKPAVLGAICTF